MDFNELKDKWTSTPEKGILPEGVKHRMWNNIEKATIKKRRRSYRWIAAACILLLLSIGSYQIFTAYNTNEAKMITVQTYPDDIRLLRLPDGSRVWVNQNTRIEYPETFKEDTRPVVLQGEAYFDVAKDKSKPFIITSGKITTTVVGTSFSITSYKGNAPEVLVRSGKVKVKSNENEVFLERGDAAIYEPKSNRLHKRDNIAVPEPKWKKALIDVDGLTLHEVLTILKKDNTFTVNYASDDLRTLKIRGTLDSRQGYEEMFQTIAFALQVKIEPEGPANYRISK